MSQSLFDHINSTPVFSNADVAVRMTDAEVASLRKRLFAEKRVGVSPNRFNKAVPYQVSSKWTDRTTGETAWTNYGRFSDLDAASYIGTIVGISVYGAKALRGSFDAVKAQASPECIAWLADSRNQEVILKAQENLDGTQGA